MTPDSTDGCIFKLNGQVIGKQGFLLLRFLQKAAADDDRRVQI